MRLERVTEAHQAAYVRMIEDFEAAGEEFSFNDAATAREDFARFVADLEDGHAAYDVRPSARRRGYATAGLRLLGEQAAADGLSGLVLMIAPDNVGSRGAATANGAWLRTAAADVAEPDGEDLWWLPVPPTATR